MCQYAHSDISELMMKDTFPHQSACAQQSVARPYSRQVTTKHARSVIQRDLAAFRLARCNGGASAGEAAWSPSIFINSPAIVVLVTPVSLLSLTRGRDKSYASGEGRGRGH